MSTVNYCNFGYNFSAAKTKNLPKKDFLKVINVCSAGNEKNIDFLSLPNIQRPCNISFGKVEDKTSLKINYGKQWWSHPQGTIGKKLPKWLEYSSSHGGQPILVMKATTAMPKNYKVVIASQRVANLNGDFANHYEKLDNNVETRRFYVGAESNNKIKHYLDKQAVKNQKNQFYPNMPEWGRKNARYQIEKGEVYGEKVLNYYDSYIAYTNEMNELKKAGLKVQPRVMAIPHSLGYTKKVVGLINKNIAKDLEIYQSEQILDKKDFEGIKRQNILKEAIKEHKNNPKELTRQLIFEHSKLLNEDPKHCLPARILTERLMFADKNIIGSVNSPLELEEQLLTGPYTIPFEDVPSVADNKSNLSFTYPGIDTERFGIDHSERMQPHEDHAAKFFKERLKKDINTDRRHLPSILVMGRFDPDKKFEDVAEAFKIDLELQKKANLVFLIHGTDEKENRNLVQEMIDNKGQNTLKNFKDDKIPYLKEIAGAMKDESIKGKWTSISLPNGYDFAGLQRHLGRQSIAVSGIVANEPYGLVWAEGVEAGIAQYCHEGAGARGELEKHGAIIVNARDPKDIAKGIGKTIDNLDDIRKKQMDYTKTKKWPEVVKKYIAKLDKIPKDRPIGSSYDKPIIPDSPEFVEKGKRLIKKTLEHETADLTKGLFKDIFKVVKQVV